MEHIKNKHYFLLGQSSLQMWGCYFCAGYSLIARSIWSPCWVSVRCLFCSLRNLHAQPHVPHPYPAVPRLPELPSPVIPVVLEIHRQHCRYGLTALTSPSWNSTKCTTSQPALSSSSLIPSSCPSDASLQLCPHTQGYHLLLNHSAVMVHSADRSCTILFSDFASALGQEIYLF